MVNLYICEFLTNTCLCLVGDFLAVGQAMAAVIQVIIHGLLKPCKAIILEG